MEWDRRRCPKQGRNEPVQKPGCCEPPACAEVASSVPWKSASLIMVATWLCPHPSNPLQANHTCFSSPSVFVCFLFFVLSQGRAKKEPGNDESRGFPHRAPMLGLADSRKALVSQAPGSVLKA